MMRTKDYMKILLKFWEYKNGRAKTLLEKEIKRLYGDKPIYLFGNGRSGMYIFLKSLGLPRDSNVIIQSFTCNAVVNPVLWLDLEPRYVDIDSENFSASLESLKKKIDGKTKVIVVQHTFGLPAQIDEIVKLAKQRDILVFEDCAHSLGNTTTGTRGDATLLSFGIEKMLATRAGGALVLNNPRLRSAVEKEYKKLGTMGYIETFIWLLNPVFWRFLRVMGPLKYPAAKFLRGIGLLNMGFENPELLGRMPKKYPKKLSNALSSAVLAELRDLQSNLSHRRKNVALYEKLLGQRYGELPLVRYPYLMKDFVHANRAVQLLREKGYLVGDWYRPVIYPASTNIGSMKYVNSSCPVAEDIAGRIVNLPTGANITREDVEKIANLVNSVRNET